MFYSFLAIPQFQFVLIGFGIFTFFFILIVLFVRKSQDSIKASDGTVFSSEQDCVKYEESLEKIRSLYEQNSKGSSNIESFGIDKEFIFLLKEKGFSDVKTIMQYRKEFKLLAELFV